MSSFCRHNRFISECPICAKGTVLDPERSSGSRPRSTTSSTRTSARRASGPALAKPSHGPYASAGPYGSRELRLERVPGGLRLASWRGGQLERVAPMLEERDLPALLTAAVERELFTGSEAAALCEAFDLAVDSGSDGDALTGAYGGGTLLSGVSASAAPIAGGEGERRFGRSAGRSGELRDELRVETLEDGELRVARWLMRPNHGWELQEAPVMLPPKRFVQALADAARRGVLVPAQPTG